MSERRKALLALVLISPTPAVGMVIAYFLVPGPIGTAAYTVSKAVLYGLPLVWLLWVDGGRLSASPMRRGGLGVGLGSGLLIAAAMVTVWWLAGPVDGAAVREALAPMSLDDPGRFLAVAVWMSFFNALLEEYAFRWFVHSRLRALLPAAPAVFVAALVFTAHHVVLLKAFFDWPLVAAGTAGVLLGGLIWSAMYERYGSLWPGWVSHVIADLAIFYIGYREIFG